MELKQVTGCTAWSLTVNGKEEIHLTPEERKEMWPLHMPNGCRYYMSHYCGKVTKYEKEE